jgi:glucose/arabinose dehydrogenase
MMPASHLPRRRRALLVLVSCLLGLLAWLIPQPSTAQLPEWTLPPQFTFKVLAAGLYQPTGFAFLPDGRMLVMEQAGFVKLYKDGQLQLAPALDLTDEVNGAAERGLTGIGIDKDFPANGYVYLLYTYDKPDQVKDDNGFRQGQLARFTMKGDVIDPASKKVLLDGVASDVPFHAPGSIRIAKDGTLFASFGDASDPYVVSDLSLRSQDLDLMHGKIIHIDRDGNALPGNAFYDPVQPAADRSKVYATGFRNPFRFTLHPDTQVPYAGNVGWSTIDSIVIAKPGVNFGWPCFESYRPVPEFADKGACPRLMAADVVKADYDYEHSGNNASVTGGDFNIYDAFPPEMRGSYFFGDYSQRWIKRAVLDKDGRFARVEDFAAGVGAVVDLQFGRDGALYLIDYLGGRFARIDFLPNAKKPALNLTVNGRPPAAIQGIAPLNVTFSAANATTSSPPLTFWWDVESRSGVGANTTRLVPTSSPTLTHIYKRAGEYTARVFAVDGNGWMDTVEVRVTVRDTKPSAQIVSPGDGDAFLPGQRVTLNGRGFDMHGGALPAQTLSWIVEWRDGQQRRTLASGAGDSISFIMPNAQPSVAPSRMEEVASAVVTLRVTDDKAIVGETQIRLKPQPRDGYIRSWWLIGGFPQRGLYDDLLPGGEARFVLPADGAGAQLIQSASRKIDLASHIQPAENNVAYAFIWIDSPSDREALLGMNSDDGIAVWLNNQEVWRNRVNRFVPDDTRDLDLPKVQLKQGRNTLLVKVDQTTGEWAFKLRVLNLNGAVMRDVVALTKP